MNRQLFSALVVLLLLATGLPGAAPASIEDYRKSIYQIVGHYADQSSDRLASRGVAWIVSHDGLVVTSRTALDPSGAQVEGRKFWLLKDGEVMEALPVWFGLTKPLAILKLREPRRFKPTKLLSYHVDWRDDDAKNTPELYFAGFTDERDPHVDVEIVSLEDGKNWNALTAGDKGYFLPRWFDGSPALLKSQDGFKSIGILLPKDPLDSGQGKNVAMVLERGDNVAEAWNYVEKNGSVSRPQSPIGFKTRPPDVGLYRDAELQEHVLPQLHQYRYFTVAESTSNETEEFVTEIAHRLYDELEIGPYDVVEVLASDIDGESKLTSTIVDEMLIALGEEVAEGIANPQNRLDQILSDGRKRVVVIRDIGEYAAFRYFLDVFRSHDNTYLVAQSRKELFARIPGPKRWLVGLPERECVQMYRDISGVTDADIASDIEFICQTYAGAPAAVRLLAQKFDDPQAITKLAREFFERPLDTVDFNEVDWAAEAFREVLNKRSRDELRVLATIGLLGESVFEERMIAHIAETDNAGKILERLFHEQLITRDERGNHMGNKVLSKYGDLIFDELGENSRQELENSFVGIVTKMDVKDEYSAIRDRSYILTAIGICSATVATVVWDQCELRVRTWLRLLMGGGNLSEYMDLARKWEDEARYSGDSQRQYGALVHLARYYANSGEVGARSQFDRYNRFARSMEAHAVVPSDRVIMSIARSWVIRFENWENKADLKRITEAALEELDTARHWLNDVEDVTENNRLHLSLIKHRAQVMSEACTNATMAIKLFEELKEQAQLVGNVQYENSAIFGLGANNFVLGNYDKAREYFEATRAAAVKDGSPWGVAASYGWLARIAFFNGDMEKAKRFAEESLVFAPYRNREQKKWSEDLLKVVAGQKEKLDPLCPEA